MTAARRWSWLVFIGFAALAVVFGAFPGTWFDEEPYPRDAQWLSTTYAGLAAVLTAAIAATAFRRGERWAWLAFWSWPVFFVVHGIVVFAFDFVFAAIGVAALLATRPTAAGR